MSLSDYQIPQIQSSGLLQTQLNTILADIKSRLDTLETGVVSGTVNTTDATATTVCTIATASNKSLTIEGRIVGRRTGGSSGSAGDSAGYIIAGAAKNVAGTLTIISQSLLLTAEDQAAWTAALVVSGTNLLVKVTGAANNNVSWSFSGKTVTV